MSGRLNGRDQSPDWLLVALFNLKTNAAVRAACGCLDDQEGRAFIAADLLGIELARNQNEEGNSRRNDARRLGEEIDEKLPAAQTECDYPFHRICLSSFFHSRECF